MSLRHRIRKVEAATREAAGTMTLIDERDGSTHHVPRDAFLRLLGTAWEQGRNPQSAEIDPEIAEIVPTEDDPEKLYHLFLTNGDPFWWQPEQCHMRDVDGDEE